MENLKHDRIEFWTMPFKKGGGGVWEMSQKIKKVYYYPPLANEIN